MSRRAAGSPGFQWHLHTIPGALGILIPFVSDSFSRPDNALTMSNADTGQAWTAQLGIWGISNGRAYCTAGAYGVHIATIPGIADAIVEASMAYDVGNSDVWLLFRYVDNANYWGVWVWNVTGNLFLYKQVGGVFTIMGFYAAGIASGVTSIIRVILSGSSIIVYLNGEQRFNIIDAALAGATVCGIKQEGSAGDNSRFDNFRVLGPP